VEDRLAEARERSWQVFGKRITFYLPGMFSYNGLWGKYPGLSITGSHCALQCDHCKASLLDQMIPAATPDALVEQCRRFSGRGHYGVLISGGCDLEGRLPWQRFLSAIAEIKRETGLYVSIHCGLVDDDMALALKEVGVDQALIDVVGDDETYRRVYHVPFGVSRIAASLESLNRADLPAVPHIVCGLHYGLIRGERRAIEMISQADAEQVVIVSLMRVPGTPARGARSPEAEEIADLVAEARFRLAGTRISLGCARERGNARMEVLAVDAGVNRMAIPSDEAIRRAEYYGLEIRYQRTCCSVSRDLSQESW
jgi:uncharacterized radical SAM superfamily protein